MYRRQLRKVFDSSFIAAATKKDRSLNPLLNMVVEPNEKIQLDFAEPLPDENNKDVYILVGVDRFTRFAKNKADTIIRFMQTHIVNDGSHETYGVIRHKGFGRKS